MITPLATSSTLIPVLALDVGDLLTTLIMLAVVIFGIVGSIVQSLKQAANKPQRDRRAQEESESEQGGQTASQRLEELAERRRQQLEELARRRRAAQQQGGGKAQASGGSDATTQRRTTERQARDQPDHTRQSRQATERAEHEQRDARERTEREYQSGRERSEREYQVQRQKAARDEELERQREYRRRASNAEKRERDVDSRGSAGDDAQQKRLESMRGQQRKPATRAGMSSGLSGSPSTMAAGGDPYGTVREVSAHANWLRGLAGSGPRELQRAVILREVLGKPVGMRDPMRLPVEE